MAILDISGQYDRLIDKDRSIMGKLKGSIYQALLNAYIHAIIVASDGILTPLL